MATKPKKPAASPATAPAKPVKSKAKLTTKDLTKIIAKQAAKTTVKAKTPVDFKADKPNKPMLLGKPKKVKAVEVSPEEKIVDTVLAASMDPITGTIPASSTPPWEEEVRNVQAEVTPTPVNTGATTIFDLIATQNKPAIIKPAKQNSGPMTISQMLSNR